MKIRYESITISLGLDYWKIPPSSSLNPEILTSTPPLSSSTLHPIMYCCIHYHCTLLCVLSVIIAHTILMYCYYVATTIHTAGIYNKMDCLVLRVLLCYQLRTSTLYILYLL